MENIENPENIDKIESPETEPMPFATVYIVRHGDTEYKEELVDPEIQDDLTNEGREQIGILTEKINADINEGDKVYVMSSPRARAEDTAKIIQEAIGKQGHEVIELRGGKTSLRNFKFLDKEGKDIYEKKDKEGEYLADMRAIFDRLREESDYYLKYREGTVLNSHNEDLERYKQKIQTFLRRIADIARKRGGKNEKLVIATHGEWLDSILELYFSRTIEKIEDSANKGEAIKMEILPDKLKFYFRDQEVVIDA